MLNSTVADSATNYLSKGSLFSLLNWSFSESYNFFGFLSEIDLNQNEEVLLMGYLLYTKVHNHQFCLEWNQNLIQ